MALNEGLDIILNKASKITIMRLFIQKREGFARSGREIARLTGLSAPAAHAALKELHAYGMLKRDIVGRQHVYALDDGNIMVRQVLIPLFRKEISVKKEVRVKYSRCRGDKNVYIIAGPNGSGKTTFARVFLPVYAECPHFVNSDLIATGLSPFSPQAAAIKAGRLVLEQIRGLADRGADFGFETTLAGRSYVRLLSDLKERDYCLHLFYIWVPTVELALERIKERVAEGGHNVPPQDVRRRFRRGAYNFFKHYKPLLDSWTLLNNSSARPALIAKEIEGELILAAGELFEKIAKIGSRP